MEWNGQQHLLKHLITCPYFDFKQNLSLHWLSQVPGQWKKGREQSSASSVSPFSNIFANTWKKQKGLVILSLANICAIPWTDLKSDWNLGMYIWSPTMLYPYQKGLLVSTALKYKRCLWDYMGNEYGLCHMFKRIPSLVCTLSAWRRVITARSHFVCFPWILWFAKSTAVWHRHTTLSSLCLVFLVGQANIRNT